MGAGTFFLILLIIAAIAIGIPVAIAMMGSRPRGLDSDQKVELRELKLLVDRLDRLALSNQDVNPELSYQIRDEIRNHEMKELS